ncbi:uncharacterized protein ACN427_005120 isoform 1-T1 [Glossina fuscipes fuscipes]
MLSKTRKERTKTNHKNGLLCSNIRRVFRRCSKVPVLLHSSQYLYFMCCQMAEKTTRKCKISLSFQLSYLLNGLPDDVMLIYFSWKIPAFLKTPITVLGMVEINQKTRPQKTGE